MKPPSADKILFGLKVVSIFISHVSTHQIAELAHTCADTFPLIPHTMAAQTTLKTRSVFVTLGGEKAQAI